MSSISVWSPLFSLMKLFNLFSSWLWDGTLLTLCNTYTLIISSLKLENWLKKYVQKVSEILIKWYFLWFCLCNNIIFIIKWQILAEKTFPAGCISKRNKLFFFEKVQSQVSRQVKFCLRVWEVSILVFQQPSRQLPFTVWKVFKTNKKDNRTMPSGSYCCLYC